MQQQRIRVMIEVFFHIDIFLFENRAREFSFLTS